MHLRYFSNEVNCPHDGRIPLFLITFATSKFNTNRKYKLVSHGKNMLIVESLTDNKRVPAYAKDKVISLGDIAIYTDETEVPLHEVLTSVKNKEEGKTASLVPSKATTDQLRAYFAEVLPSYDRERVYPSDIKKLLSWYNILINAGITDFTPEDAPAEKEAAEKEAE